jgi:hypothetical protein
VAAAHTRCLLLRFVCALRHCVPSAQVPHTHTHTCSSPCTHSATHL